MRPVLPAVVLTLLCAAPAAAQVPEEPVGPVSYQPYLLQGERPATAPRSTPVTPSGTTLGLQTAYVPRKSAEPTIGIDRQGRGFFAAGAFDGTPVGGAARTEIYRSIDGGLGWTEVTPKAGPQEMAPATLDPFVYVDQRTDRVYSIDLYGGGSYLTFSDDGGETWQPSTISAPGVNDHQTFFTGPKAKSSPLPASPLSWPTDAYYCVNAITHVACSRSTDGGLTFQPLPSSPYTDCLGCQTGHGAVDPDGRVLLPRAEFISLTGNNRVELAISEDGGASWDVVEVAKGAPASQRHTSVATDSDGNIYYTWFDARDKLPWLVVSRDHGKTWGTPMMVAPPGVHDSNFPVVIAGDAGRVALAFPASSVDAQNDATRPWHAWVTVSDNALDERPTFHAAIADDGTDPMHRGTCDGRCAGMFDFIDIKMSPVDGSAWASFSDTCTGPCVAQRKSGLATDARGFAVRTVAGPSLLADTSLQPPAGKPAGLLTGASPVATADRRAPELALTRAAWRASEPVSLELTVRRGGRVVHTATTGRPSAEGRLSLRGVRGELEVRATDAAGNATTRAITLG